jgi:hypothetical protein
MSFQVALRQAMTDSGWSKTRVAAVCDVTEGAVQKWLNGAEPGLWKYLALRKHMPGFAALSNLIEVDSEVARAS